MEFGDHKMVAINGVALDVAAGLLRDKSGREITLSPQASAVLKYLLDNPDRLVTKHELMEAVWPVAFIANDSLVQSVRDIRRALGDETQSILKSVPKHGYRLTFPVHQPTPKPSFQKRVLFAAAAAALLMLSGVAGFVVDYSIAAQPERVLIAAELGAPTSRSVWTVVNATTQAVPPPPPPAPPTTRTTTLVITSADNGKSFSNYKISTTSGNCVVIDGASNVTFQGSDIGPCGTSNTTSPSNGIYVIGGTENKIYDNYVHVETLASGCCDSHIGILIERSSYGVIEGNIVAYGEGNIQLQNSDHITVSGNFMLNPRGPFPRGTQFQAANSTNTTVSNNFALSTNASTLGQALGTGNSAPILYDSRAISDSINFWRSSNNSARGNYVSGGVDGSGCTSDSGCCLIADSGANSSTFVENTCFNTGQCGVAVASGTDQVVKNNKILNLNPTPKGGNTALPIFDDGTYAACGPVQVRGNISTEIRADGYASGYWSDAKCGVSCDGANANVDSCNTFDYGSNRAAYNLLRSDLSVTRPPAIPPGPKNCVAKSPYSTQTSLPGCQ
jgi:DNA-binding winged helix-turn-helix (wHTH) protein